MEDENYCPSCGEPAVKTCKCPRGDSKCKNGHEWHKCTYPGHEGTLISGHTDHSIPIGECSCGPELQIARVVNIIVANLDNDRLTDLEFREMIRSVAKPY